MTETLTLFTYETHERADGSFAFRVYSFQAGCPIGCQNWKVLAEDTRPTRGRAYAEAKRLAAKFRNEAEVQP